MRENAMTIVFQNYNRQDFKPKEMIVILNNNKMNLKEWVTEGKKYKNVKVSN